MKMIYNYTIIFFIMIFFIALGQILEAFFDMPRLLAPLNCALLVILVMESLNKKIFGEEGTS
jgi:uncharacterized membrane protein